VSCINATSLISHATVLSLGGKQSSYVRLTSNDRIELSGERHGMRPQNPPQRFDQSEAPAPPPRPTSNYGSTYQPVSGTLDPSVAVNVRLQQYIASAGLPQLPLATYTPYDVGVSNNTGAYHLPNARLPLPQNELQFQASGAVQPMVVTEPVRTGWAMLERFGGDVQSHPPIPSQGNTSQMSDRSVETHSKPVPYEVEAVANEVSGPLADRSR